VIKIGWTCSSYEGDLISMQTLRQENLLENDDLGKRDENIILHYNGSWEIGYEGMK
jgi:hypothetical protein